MIESDWVFVVMWLLAIIFAVVMTWREHKRRKARAGKLRSYAARRGFKFDPTRLTPPPLKRHAGFFAAGKYHAALHTMSCTIESGGRSFRLVAGDFEFNLQDDDKVSLCTVSYALLRCKGWSMPATRLLRRDYYDEYADIEEMIDVRTESVAFNKFCAIRTKDKRFSYDVAHPRAMERIESWLRSGPNPLIEIGGEVILFTDIIPESISSRIANPDSKIRLSHRVWTPQEFDQVIEDLRRFIELFPEHLARDLDNAAST